MSTSELPPFTLGDKPTATSHAGAVDDLTETIEKWARSHADLSTRLTKALRFLEDFVAAEQPEYYQVDAEELLTQIGLKFRIGDRVTLTCTAKALCGLVGTVNAFAAFVPSGELYNVRLDDSDHDYGILGTDMEKIDG